MRAGRRGGFEENDGEKKKKMEEKVFADKIISGVELETISSNKTCTIVS